MAPKYPKIVGYDLIEQIGGGGFSTVFRAVNIPEHRVAACKLVRLTASTSEKERKAVEREMRIQAALKHTHVLEFLNAVVVETKHAKVYVPGIYMLLEFAGGGDLFDKIAPDVGLEEDLAHYYFLQLISGMHYIHSQGVCHRDLKPENLLLDAAGQLKISDFGLSSVYKLKESGKTRMLSERCGSLPYVAPELNSDEPYHAEPIDVWGVGVILFTLLVGNTPWDEPTSNSPEFCAYVDGSIFRQDPWCRIPGHPLSLVKGILTVDPRERMTLDEVFQHSWCIRPSQLSHQNPIAIADRLIASIKAKGEMKIAAPDIGKLVKEQEARAKREEVRVKREERRRRREEREERRARGEVVEDDEDEDEDEDEEEMEDEEGEGMDVDMDDGTGSNANAKDDDGDQMMLSSTNRSQFTQSLMLFSQTQSGQRYTPHLTRFYSSLAPPLLMSLIKEFLESQRVKCKLAEMPANEDSASPTSAPAPPTPTTTTTRDQDQDSMDASSDTITVEPDPIAPYTPPPHAASGKQPRSAVLHRMRIGGYDLRKQMFKGWVEVEPFSYRGSGSGGKYGAGFSGSFCVMKRDEGSPISWRQLWKGVVGCELLEGHVLRK